MKIRFTIDKDNKIEYFVFMKEMKEIDKETRCSACGKLEEKMFVRGINDREEFFCKEHKPNPKTIMIG